MGRGILDELGNLWADEDDGLSQDSETLSAEVLKGKTDDLVIEPIWPLQQGHIRAPQQAVPVTEHDRIHPERLDRSADRLEDS